MYNEWPLIEVNALFEESKWSVLHKLPYVNGQNIVNSVVRPLAGNLKSGQSIGRDSHTSIGVNDNVFTDQEAANYLRTDRDVQWVMEVICFGLSLPLNTTEQHEALRDCVNIYCEWIHSLIPNESAIKVIPSPVLNDPNQYFRRIIQHLYNVFLLRTNSNYSIHSPSPSPDLNPNDIISRQAMLCHRVLRTIASITQDETNVMDRETWELLLLFLLAINNSLLAPPTDKDDIGRAKLCERVVGVLFEIWTIACSKYFPNPSFWKTFHHLCCSWRHQPALIDQWSRVCLIFTQRLLQLTYSVGGSTSVSESLSTIISAYCIQMVNKMSKETVSEAWYKLLNTIGNPVDLHSPSIISKTCKFHYYTSESLVDPRQHPCLNELPLIFFKAMKGLSMLVDTFLGLPFEFEIDALDTESTRSMGSSNSGPSIVPMPRKHSAQKGAGGAKVQKKGGLLLGKPPKTSQHGGPSVVTSQSSHSAQSTIPTSRFVRALTFSQSKPKVNSILNVLGNWLFNACMIATKFYSQTDNFDEGVERSTSSASFGSSADQSRKSSVGAGSDRISLEVSSSLLPENFEGGQSEAIGALCRLFSSKRTDEEISSVYLARFYLALQHGLSVKENTRGQVMSSILLNGTKLFQINLNGINILLPDFLKAMEMIITDSEQETKINFIVPITELRRACIKLLLSMISYPLHFDGLPIKDSLTDSSSFTFRSLRPRILNLMINALKTEQDSLNVQMLLSSFLICIQESCAYEKEMPNNKNTSPLDSMSYENKESSQAEPPNTVEHLTTHQPSQTPTLSASFQGKGDIPDTARDIFSRTLNLVCQLLANTWKNDTQVSLAALETLVSMARVKFAHTDHESILTFTEESKLVTKWICDFIIYQCSRPPPHHSKDMHSTIVASYQCLNVWFHEHSYLLSDRDCINYLMDVIELGISGSKSRSGSGYTLKAQKELKPASMRVREAAESLLTCLMNHFGNCPSAPCPPEMVTGCCLLDETSILKSLGVDVDSDPSTNWSKYFKYFVVENSILLAIVDHPSAKRSICIIRSAFGKYCWSMKFQVIPSKGSPRPPVENVPRPVPHRGSTSKRNIVPRFFPESLDKIPLTKLDTVVPSLSQIIKSNSKLKSDHDKMVKMVEKQALDERELEKRCLPLILFSECKPPKPKEDMECSRLILSHLGFLSLESNSKQSDTTTCTNSLVYLDPKSVDLLTDIRALDMISTRTSDTGFVFYVRKGRVHPQEILNSVSSKHYVSSQFIDFLSSLGCSMKVSQHFGWTGNVYTSWKYKAEDTSSLVQDPIDEHGGSAYDGHRMALYWADVCHEIAFIVPSGRYPEEDSVSLDSESKGRTKSTEGSETHMDIRSLSSLSDDGMSNSSLSRNLSEPESSRNSWRRKNKQLSFVGNIGCDTKILIIWLESLEDEPAIPISSLLLMTNTGVETNMCNRKDYIAILIHPFKNDLFAVRITSSLQKLPLGLPLIDGMVVSKRVLGFATRTTCLNLCRRRRLDAESFQPPHVKRRLKVQEMAKKYKIEGSDFYYSLFT